MILTNSIAYLVFDAVIIRLDTNVFQTINLMCVIKGYTSVIYSEGLYKTSLILKTTISIIKKAVNIVID